MPITARKKAARLSLQLSGTSEAKTLEKDFDKAKSSHSRVIARNLASKLETAGSVGTIRKIATANVTASTIKAESPLPADRTKWLRGNIFGRSVEHFKDSDENGSNTGTDDKGSFATAKPSVPTISSPALITREDTGAYPNLEDGRRASESIKTEEDYCMAESTPRREIFDDPSPSHIGASQSMAPPKTPIAQAASKAAKEAFGSAKKAFNSMLSSEDSVMRASCIEILATDVEQEARAKAAGAHIVAKVGIDSLEDRLRGTSIQQQHEFDAMDPFALAVVERERGYPVGIPAKGIGTSSLDVSNCNTEGSIGKASKKKSKGKESGGYNKVDVESIVLHDSSAEGEVYQEARLPGTAGGKRSQKKQRLHLYVTRNRHGVQTHQRANHQAKLDSEANISAREKKSSVFGFATNTIKRTLREQERTRLARRTSLDIAGAHVRSVSNALEVDLPLGLGEEDTERDFREYKKRARPWK